jgi:hypothetical protein
MHHHLDEIDAMHRRMAEMQGLVLRQRSAMEQLRSGQGARPPIAREAARLQDISSMLEELDSMLATSMPTDLEDR